MNISRREFTLSMLVLAGCASTRRTRQLRTWETGRIQVPGGNVLWRALGDGPRTPFLMVHGGGGGGSSSKPYEMLGSLADDRRLVTWDQLDAGDSDKPRDPANWTLARFVEELDTVRRELTPGPVHVMGGSWGSTLLMEWLITRRPREVVSVIFMCPTLDLARADTARRAAQLRLSPASREAFQKARPNEPPSPALIAANEEYRRTFISRHATEEMRGGPPDSVFVRAMGVDLRGWNRTSELGSLMQPVLLVRGEHDYISEGDLRAYAEFRPGTEIATIPDAAHLAFVDNPEATARVLRRFLENVERGA